VAKITYKLSKLAIFTFFGISEEGIEAPIKLMHECTNAQIISLPRYFIGRHRGTG